MIQSSRHAGGFDAYRYRDGIRATIRRSPIGGLEMNLSLTKCRTCSGEVSRNAGNCSHCGESIPGHMHHSLDQLGNIYCLLRDLGPNSLIPLLTDDGEFQNGFILNAKGGKVIIHKIDDARLLVILDGDGIYEEHSYCGDSAIARDILAWYDNIITYPAFHERLIQQQDAIGMKRRAMLKEFLQKCDD